MSEPQFSDVVRARHSVRAFLPEPVDPHVLREVLEVARRTPSNSNAQPWQVHLVSGALRDELAAALLAAERSGAGHYDFDYDPGVFDPEHAARVGEGMAARLEALGIERGDTEARARLTERNWDFYGAPHVALIFVPRYGDGAMWGLTFMYALTARGLGSVPQTLIAKHSEAVREVLGVDAHWQVVYAVSFGREDVGAPINSYRTSRAPLGETVVTHGLDLG